MVHQHQNGARGTMASVNNIQLFREARGWSRPVLAQKMGTTPQQIERLEKGQRTLRQEWIDKAASAFEVDPAQIITPQEGELPAKSVPARREHSIEDLAAEHGWVLIDEIDLSLGMGATFLDSDRAPERLGLVPFAADWISDMYRGSITHLKVVRGRGDSMEPTIRDGDFVLIDTSRRRLDEQDVVWAVSYGELGMIRRLRQMPGGGVQLMPDNSVVRPTEAYDGEMHIMGRVIWIGRRM
jgi:phage repressor protein C with HTH and peptisase S24 domain